jgi:hypothetical protein
MHVPFQKADFIERACLDNRRWGASGSIMDNKDHDWYRVSGATNPNVTVTFENLSTTLKPDVKVYDWNKSLIVEK